MLAYFFTLLGLLLAVLVFNEVYPLSAQLLRYAIVIGAFTTLLVFFFGNVEGTRLNRFVGGIMATAVLIVGGLLIFGVFEPLFAGLVLVAVFGFAFASLRWVPPSWNVGHPPTSKTPIGFNPPKAASQSQFDRMMDGIDPAASTWDTLKNYLTADTRLETATMEVQTASHLTSIATAKHTAGRLDSETTAVNAANAAAAEAGVHPNVWHSQEYQMGKLNLITTQEMKLFDVIFENMKNKLEYELDLQAAKNLDARGTHRVLDLLDHFKQTRQALEDLKNSSLADAVKQDQIRATRKTLRILETELNALFADAKQAR